MTVSVIIESMFFIYSLLYSIVLFFLLPFEYMKRPRDLRRRWLRERFGFFNSKLETLAPASRTRRNSKLVWIHAVSVGEVIAAVPFMRELKSKYPSIRLLLSTVTDTGQKVAREKVSDIAFPVYLPFDLTFIFQRVLKKIRPDIFITIETELWPNIFRLFKREGIPILVLNGRLSEGSFRGYKKIRFFIERVVRCVDLFCMQDRVYKERIERLGAEEERVKVVGNFKFDIKPPDHLPEWSASLKGPVILAGSTHEGEEELIVSVFERLRKDVPDVNLIIAPRHPERFARAEEIVKERGLPYLKRSSMGGVGNSPHAGVGGIILILDTIGELASAYGVADIAIIGGSFIDHGGHNPLEAAFWGKPVICGPHMENFPFIEDFYKKGGAVKSDAEGLYQLLLDLIRSPEKRKIIGEKAKILFDEKAGAVQRAVGILERYVEHHLAFSEEKAFS